MDKLNQIYEEPKLELVQIRLSDVITTSTPAVDDDRPDLGDLDDWSKN